MTPNQRVQSFTVSLPPGLAKYYTDKNKELGAGKSFLLFPYITLKLYQLTVEPVYLLLNYNQEAETEGYQICGGECVEKKSN